jgi:hypothetical protein
MLLGLGFGRPAFVLILILVLVLVLVGLVAGAARPAAAATAGTAIRFYTVHAAVEEIILVFYTQTNKTEHAHNARASGRLGAACSENLDFGKISMALPFPPRPIIKFIS